MVLKVKFFHNLCWLAILFGISLRCVQYLCNRSLWGDEASLALNIVDRSYLELLQPLDYNQAAPPGFLWIEKLAVQLFGNNEYALRLFPLIAGIVSLFALYELGKRSVSLIAVPIAIILFSTLKEPLYYATEVKQYSSDVMVALLLALLLIPLRTQILTQGKIILIGGLGILAIWFSYPAIFVLSGIEIANLILTPATKRTAILFNRLPLYLIWLISFVSLYFLTFLNATKNQTLQNAWKPEYPQSIFDFGWLLTSLIRFFNQPLGFQIDEVAIAVFIIGSIVFLRKNKQLFLILISPLVMTLAAAYLHKYPFRVRLILFLTPFFILIIAEGGAFLLSQFGKHHKAKAILGILITSLLIFPPVILSSRFFFVSETRHEIRPIVEYIKTHRKSDDGIFLAGGSPDQFEYYADKYGYSKAMYFILPYDDFFNPETFSEQTWEEIKRTTPHLQNKQRVWFVVSGLRKAREIIVQPSLDRIGQKIDYFSTPGSLTYLYKIK